MSCRGLSYIPSQEGPFRSSPRNPYSVQCKLNSAILVASDEAFEILREGYENKKVLAEKATDDMVNSFSALIRLRWSDLNHVNISTIVHRIGRFVAASGTHEYLCKNHSAFMSRILSLVLLHLDGFGNRNLVNVVWGLGKIGPLVKQISVPSADFRSFMLGIGQQTLKSTRRNKFSHRHLSNFVYGVACMEDSTLKSLVVTLAVQSKSIMDEFLDQEFSNLVWALAKHEFYDLEGVLSAVVNSAKKRVNSLSALEVSNIVWGLARMGYYEAADLLDMLLAPPTQRLWMKDMSPQSLSIFVWSAHSLNYKLKLIPSEKIVSSVFVDPGYDGRQTADLSLFEPQHIMIALYAYSEFGYTSKWVQKFVEAAKIYFFNCHMMFRNYDVSLLGWSLMMMDQLDGSTMSHLLRCIRFSKPSDPLQDIDARQIYQCLLHLRILHPEVVISQNVPKEVENAWRNNWLLRLKSMTIPDWMSNALVHLERMGHVCKRLTLIQGAVSTCTLDFEDGLQYAVEGLSYSRRYWTEGHPPKSTYHWKVRILRALGIEVVELDEIAWEKLVGQHAIREYLQTRIDAARQKNRIAMLHPSDTPNS